MRKLAIPVLLVLVAVIWAVQARAQSAVPVTLVKAGRLLDPRSGNVLAPAVVLIEGSKIKEIGVPAKVQAPSGAKIVDLGKAPLLPRLIHRHTPLLPPILISPEQALPPHENPLFAPADLIAIVASP